MSVAQLCSSLCDPIDCSPAGSSVHAVLQARTLEWVAIPLSRGSSQPRDPTWVSCTAGRFFTIWATGKLSVLRQYCLFPFTFRLAGLSSSGSGRPWQIPQIQLTTWVFSWMWNILVRKRVQTVLYPSPSATSSQGRGEYWGWSLGRGT